MSSKDENLIDLSSALTEPLTKNLTNEEVQKLIESPLQIREYECIS